MKLEFFGAAGTVTGSRYLLSTDRARVLVDCGMFQGLKSLREKNWQPVPPALINAQAVLLTHAHVDHSGYLPVLCREGFRGKIFTTSATRDLCAILLRDSARLQEEDARHANKHHYSKHSPARPLYTLEDAETVLDAIEVVPFDQPVQVAPGMTARLTPAGHILGAASIAVSAGERTIVFSGDLGRTHDLLMPAPKRIEHADYIVVESTYGDRRHDTSDVEDALAKVINETAERSGVVLVPAFAVGRAQAVLYHLHRLKAAKRIADLPVYLNSPMAAKVLSVFEAHLGVHHLSVAECQAMCQVAKVIGSVEESKALNDRKGPMIIIAGSGMATGGRIVHHLRQFAPDPSTTVLLVGHQAAGTRGGRLVDGADELTMFGEDVPIRARVVQMHQFSGHADYKEILDWLGAFKHAPKRVFITHGEPASSDAMRHHIEHKLKWECHVPSEREAVSLD